MPAEVIRAGPLTVATCGVIGSPIAHSLSPVLHRAAYRALGLDGWHYDAYEVHEAEVADFLAKLEPPWRGVSVTMPLKRAVASLCDRVDVRGSLLGAVNTVVIEPDGIRSGHNTDVAGMVRALRLAGVRGLDTAVVVGGGATAASALAAVTELGAFSATVVTRTPARAAALLELAAPLNLEIQVLSLAELSAAGAVDLVVSTVPGEAQASIAEALAAVAPVVFDVVYHPAVTPLLAAAERSGATVVPGFELLLHQAARQVELMTGAANAPVETMREAGMEALGSR